MSDAELDALLAEMDKPEPSSDLMGRVLGDAYEAQPVLETPAKPAVAVVRPWSDVLSIFAGVGGLATAASIGFVLGFNPPALLEDAMPIVLGDGFVNLDADIGGYGWDIDEDAS